MGQYLTLMNKNGSPDARKKAKIQDKAIT